MNRDVQKSSVFNTGKSGAIHGKGMCLPWEISDLRGKEKSAEAIVLAKFFFS